MEPPKETPRQALVRLLTSPFVKQLATNKDQMAAVLHAHERYASYQGVGHPPASPEYLQEVCRAIRLLDQSPDLAAFLEKVKFVSLPPGSSASGKPMEPYEDRMRKSISWYIHVCIALGFVLFYLFLDAGDRAAGYGLLAFFAIGAIAIRFETQIRAFEDFLATKRRRFRIWRERHWRQ